MSENSAQPTHRLSRRARLVLAAAVLFVLLPCVGLLGSAGYLKLRGDGAFSHWRSLGAPPGGGADILTADLQDVYVRSTGGAIYGCAYGDRPLAADCWAPATEPLPVDEQADFERRLFQGEVKPPAGTVRDTLAVTVWYADAAFESRLALLADGTVWVWEFEVSSYLSLFILVVGLVGGAVLGLVGAVVLLVKVRRRRDLTGL